MYPWNCCRTCLGTESLNPIFKLTKHHEKYASVVYVATGIKIQLNDSLPQEMCTTCINFINQSYKFRIKSEETQRVLQTNLEQICNIKNEPQMFKEESVVTLDISGLLPSQEEHYDVNIKLEEYNNVDKKSDEITDSMNDNDDFVPKVQVIVEKPVEIIFNRKKGRSDEEVVQETEVKEKKVKSGKDNKKDEKKKKNERMREEIECEYCHKILTSQLSLRNHYKIHTAGFHRNSSQLQQAPIHLAEKTRQVHVPIISENPSPARSLAQTYDYVSSGP